MKTKIKTIDVNALEWFDKVNGNSYFAGTICVNYQLKGEQYFKMPFQYGYGIQYEQEAGKVLNESKVINLEHYSNGGNESLWRYCDNHKIILRKHLTENCKKSQLINI